MNNLKGQYTSVDVKFCEKIKNTVNFQDYLQVIIVLIDYQKKKNCVHIHFVKNNFSITGGLNLVYPTYYIPPHQMGCKSGS